MEEKLKSSWRCVGKVVKEDRKDPSFFFFSFKFGWKFEGSAGNTF